MSNHSPASTFIIDKNYSSDYDLCKKLNETLNSLLYVKKVTKKELLLKKGTVCKEIYFIQKGAVKQSYISNEEEFVQNLFFEGNIIFPFHSFFNHIAVDYSLEVLEDSHILVLSYNHFQKLCDAHTGFKGFFVK